MVTSANPRSTPVKTIPLTGLSHSPATPPPATPTTPSCRTPTPTNPCGVGGDRSTPTGPVFSQPPASPVTSDHSGSLPRRFPNVSLENSTCISAENVHTLTGSSGYRNKPHGGARGGFGGPLSRHANFSGTRPLPSQAGAATTSASINTIPSTVVATGANSGGSSPTTIITATPATLSSHLADRLTTSDSSSNNNNNNSNNINDTNIQTENSNSVTSFGTKGLTLDSQALSAANRAESPTVSAHFKPPVVASSLRTRPQTADSSSRRGRNSKISEISGAHRPIALPARSTVQVPVSLDSDTPQPRTNLRPETTGSPMSTRLSRLSSEYSKETEKVDVKGDCSASHTVLAPVLDESTSPSPAPSSITSHNSTRAEHDDPVPVGVAVGADGRANEPLDTIDKPVTVVAMSVNVTSGPPSPPLRPSNGADTPTANGEHYWTPDPPASPSSGSVPVPSSPTSLSNPIPVTVDVLPTGFSGRSTSKSNSAQSPVRDSALGNTCESHPSRTRLESLNDVD
ncbi:unnamed protein product [Echinostoma caproni]|uniref:Uncharacterized protein n=1 Tax=Echinostoma caproni TaxID=27848 RepID=A0A3P8G4H2_9TREM|nr:unnamed protein product [Echinostoma caproni]